MRASLEAGQTAEEAAAGLDLQAKYPDYDMEQPERAVQAIYGRAAAMRPAMRRMPTITESAQRTLACLVACLLLAAPGAGAEDWPEFRGKGRLGAWNETGILERFPEEGLDIAWRTPINRGYAGPAVADGRVFLSDFARTSGMSGIERAVCLDERTGEILWTYEWEANYAGISWDEGPRATPTVDGDRVYVQGAAGTLVALNAETGEVLWTRNFREEFDADMPIYGFASSPLVDGERLNYAGRRRAGRQGRGIRQDDGRGNMAGALL